MDLTAEIEALLYVSGENGMTIKQLQKFTGADIDKIKWSIAKLKQRYDDVMYGICILQNGDIIHMATKRVYSDVISKYVNTDDELLTQSALETLTIIAYKQPITRVEIDEVRGVNSSVSVRHLLSQDLIKTVGTRDEPGKPKLYGTTDLFLNAFGLQKIADLPELDEGEDPQDYAQMFSDEMEPLEDKRDE